MKKYFYLPVLAMLIFSTGRAQIKKGQALLGGAIIFNNSKSEFLTPNYAKSSVTIVAPSFGWAIRDNLELGVRLPYSYTKQDQLYAGQSPPYRYKDELSIYGVNVYARRYKDLGHGFAIYGEGSLNGSIGRRKTIQGQVYDLWVDQKYWVASISLAAGVTYRMARRWMFETGFVGLAQARYGHITDKGQQVSVNNYPDKTNYFSMGTSLSQALRNFSFGCRYILN
ncbi:MAG TPA: hypothetical protein VIM64_05405 [Puia sp.]